jgi:hypothetical protein
MSSIGRDLPAPEGRSALKLQALLARFQATKQEIQWRGVQRDALVVLALTFTVGIYVGIDKIGAWVMLAPVPLLYVASMWLHHDRRIGFLAGYILNVVEPALKDYDDLEGLDEYLNDRTRRAPLRGGYTSPRSWAAWCSPACSWLRWRLASASTSPRARSRR